MSFLSKGLSKSVGQQKYSALMTRHWSFFHLETLLLWSLKHHALLSPLWGDVPFTCDTFLKLHHLLQVSWKQWNKNASLRCIKYIFLLEFILQEKDNFSVIKVARGTISPSAPPPIAPFHPPPPPSPFCDRKESGISANPLLSTQWCQMSQNIVHKHSPEHYPGRSTFHGNPVSLEHWGFSWSRESAWLSSFPLLHLTTPPHMSLSCLSSPFGYQPCEHGDFLWFDQVCVTQRHGISMGWEAVRSLAWLLFHTF